MQWTCDHEIVDISAAIFRITSSAGGRDERSFRSINFQCSSFKFKGRGGVLRHERCKKIIMLFSILEYSFLPDIIFAKMSILYIVNIHERIHTRLHCQTSHRVYIRTPRQIGIAVFQFRVFDVVRGKSSGALQRNAAPRLLDQCDVPIKSGTIKDRPKSVKQGFLSPSRRILAYTDSVKFQSWSSRMIGRYNWVEVASRSDIDVVNPSGACRVH